MADRSTARVAAIVQARMSSTRMPGKVLAPLAGTTVLGLLLRRLALAEELDSVALATSSDPSDDPVAEAAVAARVHVVRGPLDDVLQRYRLAVDELECDAAVRITGDCPLTDPAVVDGVVREWRLSDADYVSNTLEPRSFADGFDVEVLSREALETAAAEAEDPAEREHVTRFVVLRPERFSHRAVHTNPSYGHIRLSVDTAEDLQRVRKIIEATGPDAGMEEVLAAAGPELRG